MEKLKKHFFSLFAITLAAFVVLLAIIFNIDPESADILTLAGLYSSIFLSLSGFLTLILFYLRTRLANYEILYAQLPIAMRHAALIALAATGLLFLQMLRVLGWWEAALYVLILILLEAYFRTRKGVLT